jgi:phospholipid/cholesterol/gamma-HCH transport system substrate-binding protein
MTSKKLQPALLGGFVLLSFFLFAVAVIIFGSNKFLTEENTVIAYFDGSLQGLSVGAPVTYRGVTIGQVKAVKIHIQSDADQQHQIIIPVLISLIPGKHIIIDGTQKRQENEASEFLEAMCKQGLRAKLKLQSLVTGKLYIDLAIYKDTIPVYRDQDGTYFEIPTLPSEMHQISRVLETVNFSELYDKAISTFNSLDNLAANLDQVLASERSQHLLDEVFTATTSLNSILTKIDTKISPLLQNMDNSFAQINALAIHADQTVSSFGTKMPPLMESMATTLQQADQLLGQAEKAIQPNSPLYFRLTEAMLQLKETAGAIENLSTFLHQNPEALIYGLQKTGDTEYDQ